jgi:ABC-type transport system substrate-binding protein
VPRLPHWYDGDHKVTPDVASSWTVSPDDTTVVITCKTPSAGTLALCVPILPEHIWSKVPAIGFHEPGFTVWDDPKSKGDPLLKDVAVRQAIDYAIDKESIVATAMGGRGVPKWSARAQAGRRSGRGQPARQAAPARCVTCRARPRAGRT